MKTMSKSSNDSIDSIDRISGLPEEVLLHILSFVTTLQAVQMSLLSKRWRHLWTCIPVLYFDEYEFPKTLRDKSNAFHKFTDQVLFLRREDESIRKFHFKPWNYVNGSHVRQWVIDVARHRNVEELVVDIWSFKTNLETELSHCLSSCQSLRVLKLRSLRGCIKLPNELNLSGLKSLHLRCITSDGGSLGKLISSCHFLEDLCLQNCQLDGLNLSSNNLKKLFIYKCCGALKIKISVPSLQSFMCCPNSEQHFSLDNLVSLVEAHIIIDNSTCLSEGMVSICEILRGICNASFLTLNYCSDQHLCLPQELVECLPVFSNLTRLELETWLNKDHVEAIINILERSPNLKTLILNKTGPFIPSMPKQEDSSWTPRDVCPLFLLHLKKIKMKGFKSSALQLEFVKFLLKNTRSLPEITIIPYEAIH